MSGFELKHLGRGNVADYLFGTEEHGWSGFDVVRFHALEELSRPFEYDITLVRLASAGPADLDALVNVPASLAIATGGRFRIVHGVVAEAEELDRTGTVLLYRVLLVPHFWRARFRRRCRNFVDRPLAEIISTVLENRAADHRDGAGGLSLATKAPAPDDDLDFGTYTAAQSSYRWAVGDRSRIDDGAARDYVVQYNESDFDFVSRLLEEEGISYSFEHNAREVVMTLSDLPGHVPAAPEEAKLELQGLASGAGIPGREVVRSFREARRMRSRSVQMRDFSWKRTRAPLDATARVEGKGAELSRHFEFPAGDEDVKKEPCVHPSLIRLERFEVERNLGTGTSTVRTLEPGRRFELHDIAGLRDDAEYLVVRVAAYATQLLIDEALAGAGATTTGRAYENTFSVVPAAQRFRPEQVTQKPLIFGVQSAIVTADGPEGKQAEIQANEHGCVRVRFPWDEEPEEGTPSSRWIRVSQQWAGSGFGALHTPRVGQEVLVAYLQGDPDRPVIVGRVYNAQSPPPYNAAAQPTVSTVKSHSSPKTEGFNELRFEDLAHKEEIYLHAQRNLTEVVLASHSTSVGGSQSNSVGGDRTHSVHGHEKNTIGTFRHTTTGTFDFLHVVGERVTSVDVNNVRTVTGEEHVTVGQDRIVEVGGAHKAHAVGNYESNADCNHQFVSSNVYFTTPGEFKVDADRVLFLAQTSFEVHVGPAKIIIKPGLIVVDDGAGASVVLSGGLIVANADNISLQSKGRLFGHSDGPLVLDGGKGVSISGTTIRLNE